MRRFLSALGVALLPGLAAAQTNQGLVLSMTTTMDSVNGSAPKTMVMEYEFLGPKYRMSISGSALPAPAGGMYMINDSDAGTMTNVLAAQSMAMIMDTAMISMARPKYKFEIVGTPVTKTEDLGAGQPVAGHATHHYRATFSGEIKWTFGEASCSQKSKMVTESWTIDEPNGAEFETALLKVANMGANASADATAALDSLRRGAMKGRPLMTIVTTLVPTAKGDSVVGRSRMQITEARKRDIDPADFEVPAGFRTMDMREMMKGMDPSLMGDATANVSAAMKKSLCG